MNQYDIDIAVFTELDCFTAANRNNLHFDTVFLFEYR